MLAAESPASFIAWDLLALGDEDLRETPQAERRARLETVLAKAAPPVHLTPATRDRALAADWFDRFEGAGLDGVIAKKLDAPYQPGKRAMLKIKHQRTADCVVAGFRWHKNGPGTHIGSLLLGLYDDGGTLHHVGITSSFTWDRLARMGPMGHDRRRRCVRPAPARRDVPLEPGQGPVLGAAARRAGRRGRLRPPPGRPVPACDDVQALAAGQAPGSVSLRPARDERALRARGDLRELTGRSPVLLRPHVVPGCTPRRPIPPPAPPDFRLIGRTGVD
jgi:ATP-dependent DNA ligase